LKTEKLKVYVVFETKLKKEKEFDVLKKYNMG